MKTVLIITEYFAPISHIASIRPTKLAKYLHINHNCRTVVVSREISGSEKEDLTTKSDLQYIDEHIVIRHGKIIRRLHELLLKITDTEAYGNGIREPILKESAPVPFASLSRKQKIYKQLQSVKRYAECKSLAKQALKALKKRGLNDIDVMISTFGPLNNHIVALGVKKKYPGIRWVADFRDPMYTEQTPSFLKNKSKKVYGKVVKSAEILTAVTDSCVFEPELKSCTILSNGFDTDDIDDLQSSAAENCKLRFAYCGQTYSGRSNFGFFWRALSELASEHEIDTDNIRVDYAGPSSDDFIAQASKAGMEKLVNDNGKLPRRDALQLEADADILLLSTWNYANNTGVVSGKIYEYFMSGKPIIGLVSGDIPDSIVKTMINRSNTGFCAEEANAGEDYPALKNYIKTICEQFSKNGTVAYNPDRTYIDSFNYKNITEQLTELLFREQVN